MQVSIPQDIIRHAFAHRVPCSYENMEPRERHTHTNVTTERGVSSTPRVVGPDSHATAASKTHPTLVIKQRTFVYMRAVATAHANVPSCAVLCMNSTQYRTQRLQQNVAFLLYTARHCGNIHHAMTA